MMDTVDLGSPAVDAREVVAGLPRTTLAEVLAARTDRYAPAAPSP
jgi:hypothetical protein